MTSPPRPFLPTILGITAGARIPAPAGASTPNRFPELRRTVMTDIDRNGGRACMAAVLVGAICAVGFVVAFLAQVLS